MQPFACFLCILVKYGIFLEDKGICLLLDHSNSVRSGREREGGIEIEGERAIDGQAILGDFENVDDVISVQVNLASRAFVEEVVGHN